MEEYEKTINELTSAFNEMDSLAWDNIPDGDEETEEDFRNRAEEAAKDFDMAISKLKELLGI